MSQIYLTLIFFFIIHITSVSQDINYKIYKSEETSVINNNFTCMAIDNNNVNWFGTYDEGLVKYDGEYWTVFNIYAGEIC